MVTVVDVSFLSAKKDPIAGVFIVKVNRNVSPNHHLVVNVSTIYANHKDLEKMLTTEILTAGKAFSDNPVKH